MAEKSTPNFEQPTHDERAFVALWGDVETQAENLKLKIDEFVAHPEAAGNKPLLFYRQGINAVAASLLLLRNGMAEPASGTVRLAFENLFCAAACNQDPTYYSQLERSDAYETHKWAVALTKMNGGSVPPAPSLIDRDKRTYKAIADAGGTSALYELNYRFLSKTGAHANTVNPLVLAASAGGPLPEFNLMVGVLTNLKMCLESFEQQWARVSASQA